MTMIPIRPVKSAVLILSIPIEEIPKDCQTCDYAVAPNNIGCICSWGNNTKFHAGTKPCNHYKLAKWIKGRVKE